MEENNENAVSMQKKLQPSHDPGWNDPPAWALSAQKSNTSTTTKNLMYKRLAFPMNSKTTETAPIVPSMINMPPPVNLASLTTEPHKPVVAPTKSKTQVMNIQIDKEQALNDTFNNLYYALEQLNSSKKDEIKKRLDRMETMWKENKLNNVVCQKLLQISKALKENNVQKADEIHVSLITNNTSVCSSWMPGIRQIITEMKNKT